RKAIASRSTELFGRSGLREITRDAHYRHGQDVERLALMKCFCWAIRPTALMGAIGDRWHGPRSRACGGGFERGCATPSAENRPFLKQVFQAGRLFPLPFVANLYGFKLLLRRARGDCGADEHNSVESRELGARLRCVFFVAPRRHSKPFG